MNVISRVGLLDQVRRHPETASTLERWYRVARKSDWRGLADVRAAFPSADQVGEALIFNIMGGNFRLIVTPVYPLQKLYIKALLTHAEYNRKEWLKWA